MPCVIAALFGSSLHVVFGPTNANSLALFATLAPLAVVGSPAYIQLALAVTVLVGLMQWLIGALRLGSLANFISPSAMRGFVTGAAALIVLHSLPGLPGLPAPDSHGTGALLAHLGRHLEGARPGPMLVGAATLGAVFLARRKVPAWPNLLIGLVAGTALAAVLNDASSVPKGGGIAVVGSIPQVVPLFRWPGIDPGSLPELLSIAFALTIVALGQSISIAKAVAARSGQAIDANREFRGQGLSNIVGGFFSCYVSCGSLNRSMPNFEAGARTPLAAVFASLLLLLAIAWSLFEIPAWRRLWQHGRPDFAIALVTALATITVRLEMAILFGTILSLVTYLHRTSRPFIRVMGFDSTEPDRPFVVRADVPTPLPECPQLKMIRMEGEVYFGAVPHVADHLRELRREPSAARHLLVMAKSMNFIDLPAAELWRDELAKRRAEGGDLYFHRPRPPVLALWHRIGYTAELGADNVFATKRIAIATIFDRLDRGICSSCTVRVFTECKTLPPPVGPTGAAAPQPVRGQGAAVHSSPGVQIR